MEKLIKVQIEELTAMITLYSLKSLIGQTERKNP